MHFRARDQTCCYRQNIFIDCRASRDLRARMWYKKTVLKCEQISFLNLLSYFVACEKESKKENVAGGR